MFDLTYAWRGLRRAPAFTLIAIWTMALGVGAETALVGIIDVVTSRGGTTPTDNVYVLERDNFRASGIGADRTPRELFDALRTAPADVVSAVATTGGVETAIVQLGSRGDLLAVRVASAGVPEVFSTTLPAGRWFTDADDTAGRAVAVINERLWRRWFGGRPDLAGLPLLRVNRVPMTVVGVAPAGFDIGGGADVWIPRGAAATLELPSSPRLTTPRPDRLTTTYVRKALATPVARLDRLLADAVQSAGGFGDAHLVVHARPLAEVLAARGGSLVRARGWLLGFSALILIGACANLANMLYARGLSREGEIAVRRALGGSRIQVAKLLVTEVLLIALAASALGAVLAAGSLRLFAAAAPGMAAAAVRSSADFSPDLRTLLAALGAGAFGAVGVGLLTAWRATRTPHIRTLATLGPAGATPRDARGRTALVAVQITSAVVLVIIAGLYFENGPKLPDDVLHFDTTHVVAGRVVMDPRVEAIQPTRREAFEARLLADARHLPGVDGVAIAAMIPAGVQGAAPWHVTLSHEAGPFANVPPKRIDARYAAVSPGFLNAIDLRLLRGRDFGPSDAAGERRVAIVSESAAALLWPGEDALGQPVEFNRGRIATVVGVSADPVTGPAETPQTQPGNFAFVPLAQWTDSPVADRLLVFRATTPDASIDAMEVMAHGIDDDIALVDLMTIDRSMLKWYGPQRAVRVLMTVIGSLALLIALLGVYGVITYFVTSRTREFGIRLALGATPGRIVRLVVDHAVHIVLVGLLAGVFVASITSRIVERELFNAMPNGLATWIAVPLLILVTGVAAGLIPASRAAAVDPNVSLREG